MSNMAPSKRKLFVISDRTGITLEHLVRTLLTQFDDLHVERVDRPFLNTTAKVDTIVREINAESSQAENAPIVFSSIVDEPLRARLRQANAEVFDIFDQYLPVLSRALGMPHSDHVGLSHGMGNVRQYDKRVDAVNFALDYDDGARFQGLGAADLILVGVSRSGKTPTCLYLAMQYAVRAANFPLTEDDFLVGGFPKPLREHRDRLFGLTIAPERLHRIREQRRPGSDYASLAQCRREAAAAEDLFRTHAIPFLDSTAVSIEELAIEIMQCVGVERPY